MYIKINEDSTTFPYTITMLKLDNPNISFPTQITDEMLSDFNVFPVVNAVPTFDEYQNVRRSKNPTLVDGVWTIGYIIEDFSVDEIKKHKEKQLASLRYEKEVGGLVVSGMSIATDRISQAMISGAYIAVQLNPNRLIDWKTKDGWIQLDKPTVETIATLVSDHVQNCFTKEKEILTLLEDDVNIDITLEWQKD